MNELLDKLQRDLDAAQSALLRAEEECAQHHVKYQSVVKALEESQSGLEKAHQEWMSALDVVKDPIFLHDESFVILRCNRAYQQRANLPFKQIIGRHYYDVFPKSLAPIPGSSEKTESEVDLLVGQAIYRSRSFHVRDDRGACVYSICVLEDITLQSRLSNELLASRNLTQHIIENSPLLIYALDKHGIFTIANRKSSTLLGIDSHELIGNGRDVAMPKDIADKHRETDIEVMNQGMPIRFEESNFESDGKHYYLSEKFPLLDANGEAEGICVISVDITDRKLEEARIYRLKNLYSALSQCNQAIVRIVEEGDLLQKICEIAVKFGGMKMAAICAVNPDTTLIEAVTSYGEGAKFLDDATISIDENSPFGRGPTGIALRNCQPFWCQDYTNDPNTKPWHEIANRYGWNSEAVLPLERNGIVTAGFMLFSDTRNAFDQEACDLLTEMATDIDFALENIDRKEAQRKDQITILRANRALAALSETNRCLVYSTDEGQLLSSICSAIVKQSGYRMAWVGYLEYDEARTLRPVTYAGAEDGFLASATIVWADNERGRGPCGICARTGKMQVVHEILADDSMLPWRVEAAKRNYAACIALPLARDAQTFGVLTIYSEYADAFDENEVKLLEEMADDLAFGLRSLHLQIERDQAREAVDAHVSKLQANLEDTIKAMATIVEVRDPYTAGHQNRVSELAVAIAKALRLSEEQTHGIHLAGLVHDLGKIQVPAEILSKPGKLIEYEYELIKIHPMAGYNILKDIAFHWPIAQSVLQHHERLNGSGYPQRLKGEQIIIEARILAVADVVEAIHSHRPYRPGLGIGAAFEEISHGRGILYDPTVVDACLDLFQQHGYAFAS